jgi:hypothetical protein
VQKTEAFQLPSFHLPAVFTGAAHARGGIKLQSSLSKLEEQKSRANSRTRKTPHLEKIPYGVLLEKI